MIHANSDSIYLDNNATTAMLPEVRSAMLAVMDAGALNPSSIHSRGDHARALLKEARRSVSQMLDSSERSVTFTSGATEANQLVLQNLLQGAFGGFRLVTTSTEHSSIREALPALRRAGVDVQIASVGQNGVVSLEEIEAAILPGQTLVSVQWANNETGVLQPIEAIGEVCHRQRAVLHSDAVQAVGKVPVDLNHAGLLSMSGHKLHGPLGVGALVAAEGIQLSATLAGGGQESGLRPGTENLPAIVGMGQACRIRSARFEASNERVRSLRDAFEAGLRQAGVIEDVAGASTARLPNTSNIRVRSVDGEALLIQLNRAGVACSQSSACTNRKPEPSFVLRAMGLSEDEAFRSIRFGFSELNTFEEVDRVVDLIVEFHTRLLPFFAQRPVA